MENDLMSQLPQWVATWTMVMGITTMISSVLLIISRGHRLKGVMILLSMVIAFLMMGWLYPKFGYSKILGLVHWPWLILWPYFYGQLRAGKISGALPKYGAMLFLVVAGISLVFDITDVARWVIG